MNILSVASKSAKNDASTCVKFYTRNYIAETYRPNSWHSRPTTISHIRISFILLFIGNSVADGKNRDRRDHRAQRLATMFEALKSERRDDDAQRPRRNIEGKEYEEKKRTSGVVEAAGRRNRIT